jgi:outer membrane biosynthesis protein TonB
VRSFGILENTVMSSNGRIFFAGVGTTFVILAVGFGGGLMIAKSALNQPQGYQARASSEPVSSVRVILPTTAEAAQPPQPGSSAPNPEPQAQTEPVRNVEVPVQKQIEKVDTRKAQAEERERRRRYAERKAKKLAAARAHQQMEQAGRGQQQPGIMAFGGEDQPQMNFFGN